MIVSALLDTVDHTPDVLSGGVQSLSYQVEDEEGKLTIPNVTLKFCNLKNSFKSVIPNRSINHVYLSVGHQKIFTGKLVIGGFQYDPDNEEVDIQAIGTENYFINNLKALRLSQVPVMRVLKLLDVAGGSDEGGMVTVKRRFFSLKDVLTLIVGMGGIDTSISNLQIDEDICIGGEAVGTSSVILLPDVSCYDFLVEVVKLFNAVWWIDESQGFVIRPKQELLKARSLEAAVQLAPIRNTMSRCDEYLGWDQVSFAYANANALGGTNPLYVDYLQWSMANNASPQRPNAAVSGWKSPFSLYYRPTAFIDKDDQSSNNFILRTDGTSSATGQKTVSAGEIIRNYYAIDVRAGMSVMTDCSLIGQPDFFVNWPPVYTRVRFPGINADFYLRTVTPDFKEDKMQVHAVNYVTD